MNYSIDWDGPGERDRDDHEEWESRMQRGTFKPADWARGVKRDIASYQEAHAARQREIEDNEGDDPMSDEYKSLDLALSHALSNVHRHLNHGVLLAIAELLLVQDWVPLAKALFQIERDPTIKDQAWFDFQGKAQRLIALMQNQ